MKRILILGILASIVFVTGRPFLRADEVSDADEKLLVEAKVDTDGPGLLKFIRSRTLTDKDREEIAGLIHQLGSDSYREREKSTAQLTSRGQAVLPFLRQALIDADPEVARRAQACISGIERGPGWSLPAAVVRLLALRKPDGSVEALLAYLPFVDDESVEEEILTTLGAVGVKGGKVDPAIRKALDDPMLARRSAAAYVVGKLGDSEQRSATKKLLADPNPKVRFRAAQGLLAAHDKDAVPVLVTLLGEKVPLALSWQVEELLYQVAGEEAPTVSVGQGDDDSRKKCRDAWSTWWRDQGTKLDLARAEESRNPLGLTVIAELESNRVWECGMDGKPRWKLEGLQSPIDAQVLAGGHRVLIAEHDGLRITERDLKGEVLWEKRVAQNPVACQRLPNGNTFIATYNSVLEVNREGKELFNHNLGGRFMIYDAQKLRNGHVVCTTAQGMILELDGSGKEVKTVSVPTNGGWSGVELLPGNRFLVALTSQNKVMEVDGTGKPLWECSVANACSVMRLSNGHTLVASMEGRKVVEVNRAGNEVWMQKTQGRPFHAHRR